METLVLTLHILACLFLIILVLLQAGKEGMGVIFGGGSSTVFGSSGAGGFLVKLTAILATVFLLTSLGYNILIGKGTKIKSLMDQPVEGMVAPDKPEAPAGVQIEEKPDAKPSSGVQIEDKQPAEKKQ